MTIECPHCQFSKEIADDKLPPLPAKVTCPQCSEQFTLEAQDFDIEEEPLLTAEPVTPPPMPTPPIPSPSQATAAPLTDAAPAGFWVRVLAIIIDSVLLQVLFYAMMLGIGMVVNNVDFESDPMMIISAVGMSWTLSFAYYVFFTGYCGQTPGKMALRVKVIHNDGGPVGYGQAFVREVIGKFLSSLILCIGYLMVAFRSDKRGLHDLVASTRVVKL
ncbi:RDD family protein [uncultured Desulfuromonas sp.]|uniref:RDD family protein n=1 Tax=uncultured Desulfuromonas sp. TaxID=181013 RepID=UPI002AAC20A4|nr:RDD family protein [uncultured Desulfuromonas sp.]